jgi:hypothetical protein
MSLAGLVLFKAPASSFIAVRLVLFSYLGRGGLLCTVWCLRH